nr:MAG TPA: hypothetical protein [Crassvirales sp.]
MSSYPSCSIACCIPKRSVSAYSSIYCIRSSDGLMKYSSPTFIMLP